MIIINQGILDLVQRCIGCFQLQIKNTFYYLENINHI